MSNARNLARLLPNASGQLPKPSMASGSVIQAVSVTKTGMWSTTSTSFVDIAGLAASITPSNANSKIVALVSISGGTGGANHYYLSSFRLMRDTTPVVVGDAASGYNRVTLSNIRGSQDTNGGWNLSMNGSDSPNTTSSITYKVQCFIESAASVIRINGSGGDDVSGAGWSGRGVSTITLLEIAP